MASCRDDRELLSQVRDTIEKINEDLGMECIKFTTIDTNLLNKMSKEESSTFIKGEWIDNEQFKLLNSIYTDLIIKNLFDNNFERYKIKPYGIRSVEYNSETYDKVGSRNYHRDFHDPEKDRFAAKGTWNIIAYQNLKNCDFKNAGTGLVYLINKTLPNGHKIKLCQNIILPAFEGLVLAIKDNCFYHYTPKVMVNPGESVERTLIRNYLVDRNISEHGYELDLDELQFYCTQKRNIERLLSRENLDPIPLIPPRSDISRRRLSEPIELEGGYKDINY